MALCFVLPLRRGVPAVTAAMGRAAPQVRGRRRTCGRGVSYLGGSASQGTVVAVRAQQAVVNAPSRTLPVRPPRRLVILAGEQRWAEETTARAVAHWRARASGLRVLVADDPRAEQPAQTEWMGQELDVVVLNAEQQNFLDTFGAVCGALRGGGVLLLRTPDFASWRRSGHGEHWCRLLDGLLADPQASPAVALCLQGEEVPVERVQPLPPPALPSGPHGGGSKAELVPTEEQRRLIEAVLRTTGASPLLVSGRRGRGKSAALGMAAAVVLQRGGGHVLVTSPSQPATWQLFEAAERYLGGDCDVRREGPFVLRVGQQGRLDFMPPADLLHGEGPAILRSAQFLFIDEAAGLPVSLAAELLWRARRVVMSTTLDGYEGSGQGFLIRALPKLKKTRQEIRHIELQAPLRWERGCPLETLVNAAMFLDAAPAPSSAIEMASAETVTFERLDRSALVGSEGQAELSQIFGLLRCSHYKTKPSDLRFFLDMPNIRWYVLRCGTHVIGLTIATVEDPIEDPTVAEEVYLRQRKAPPQLIAQTLSHEAGFLEATSMRHARVMRLCVHPAVQRRGLGERLLAETLRELRALEGLDTVGACFGATPWLLRLWRRAGVCTAWLGHGCEPSSGQHSATALAPISARGRSLVERLQARFARQLPELLGGPLSTIDADTLSELLAALPPPEGCPAEGAAPEVQDRADVQSFAWGARLVSSCRYALARAALDALRPPREPLGVRSEQLLMDLLRGRPVHEGMLRQVARRLPWAQPPIGRDGARVVAAGSRTKQIVESS